MVTTDGEITEESTSNGIAIPPRDNGALVQSKTPAQSKIDAVSSLLAKAIERASDLRLTPEETKALMAEFTDDCFRGGARGKPNLIYIEHAFLRQRLNEVLGMGQWSIVPRARWTDERGNTITVYVEAMFIVRGCYVTEAVGDMVYYENNAAVNYGDAVEGAETDAMRRCCKKFGIGLQAYTKEWCEGWWRRKGTQTPANGNQQGDERWHDDHAPMQACPKCGKSDSVIQGKAEYGGGQVCFKKKNGGCGHKWGGKDVRTGEDAAPAQEHKSILAEWAGRLEKVAVLGELNGDITKDFKAIPGQNPDRPKVWALILKLAEKMNGVFSHGEKKFVFKQPTSAEPAKEKSPTDPTGATTSTTTSTTPTTTEQPIFSPTITKEQADQIETQLAVWGGSLLGKYPDGTKIMPEGKKKVKDLTGTEAAAVLAGLKSLNTKGAA